MSIEIFKQSPEQQRKITMVTCYDFTFAQIVAQSSIDAVLVGDSAAMTMHGFKDTIPANLEMMIFLVI